MKSFILNIAADNEVFQGDRNGEVARILREIAYRLELGEPFDFFQTLVDSNGNDVGRAAFKGV